MKNLLTPLYLLPYLVSSLLFATHTHAQSRPVTVVELFTSQGCYSCPPADRLLGELKQDPNTIVMACHVTYWNYLGWRDTFSRSFCDNRQRQYQQFLQGRAGVYTPQMIINGRYGVVGSRKHHVRRALAKAQSAMPPIHIDLESDTQELFIKLPDLEQTTTKHNDTHRLFLIATASTQRLPISRGENGGKTLDYHNPIIDVIPLGQWKGVSKQLIRKITSTKAIDEWIVLAQSNTRNTISAAGKVKAIPPT